MKRFWDPDTPLMRLLAAVAELTILNLCWILLCLPVITAGAATTGLYRGCLGMIRETGEKPWRLFFREFRSSFCRSTVLWLILLGALALIGADLMIFSLWPLPGKPFLLLIFLLSLLFWLVIASYTFPLTAQFENTLWGTLKNAAIFGFGHPLVSLVIVLLNALPVIMLLLSPTVFWRFFIFWVLLGFGVVAYVNSLLFLKIFNPYIPKKDSCE